jgi:hypothetical protein
MKWYLKINESKHTRFKLNVDEFNRKTKFLQTLFVALQATSTPEIYMSRDFKGLFTKFIEFYWLNDGKNLELVLHCHLHSRGWEFLFDLHSSFLEAWKVQTEAIQIYAEFDSELITRTRQN